MAVLMADRQLGARRRAPGGLDAHGDAAPPAWGALVGPYPGRARAEADRDPAPGGAAVWVLAADARLWPLEAGDVVEEPAAGRRWLVTSAELMSNTVDASADYVRIEAHSQTAHGTWP